MTNLSRIVTAVISLSLSVAMPVAGQIPSAELPAGPLILSGGGRVPLQSILTPFLDAAGGTDSARIAYIWIPRTLPEATNTKTTFEALLTEHFGVPVTLLHSNDRDDWDSDQFVQVLQEATGVWISGGSQGHLANMMLDTRSHGELQALLQRGGAYGGVSGGAMLATSFMLRGLDGKPVLVARGHTRGFGFLQDVIINPHLTAQQRESQLVTAIHYRPELLGVGIDDNTAIVVEGHTFTVVGDGRVAVYDNERHGSRWFYYLDPGTAFDLTTRTVH